MALRAYCLPSNWVEPLLSHKHLEEKCLLLAKELCVICIRLSLFVVAAAFFGGGLYEWVCCRNVCVYTLCKCFIFFFSAASSPLKIVQMVFVLVGCYLKRYLWFFPTTIDVVASLMKTKDRKRRTHITE